MTDAVSYWIASHLTGIFEIRDKSKDLLQQGSRGAGFSINRGVITTVERVSRSNVEIYFDGHKKSSIEAAVTTKVVEKLLSKKKRSNLRIVHNFEVPLSSGYGASAAGAVGTAFAINDLLELGLSRLELFQVAHKAEVLTKSGLGDVIGLYQGGLEIRIQEGAPGYGRTMPFFNSNGWKVATVHFGTLPTSKILLDPQKRKAVNNAGREVISELINSPNFSTFVKLATIFSEKANLWSLQLRDHIEKLPTKVVGSQIMLGEAFFVFYHDTNDLTHIKIPITQINEETICQNTVVRRE